VIAIFRSNSSSARKEQYACQLFFNIYFNELHEADSENGKAKKGVLRKSGKRFPPLAAGGGAYFSR
jgi:hypothetical protein